MNPLPVKNTFQKLYLLMKANCFMNFSLKYRIFTVALFVLSVWADIHLYLHLNVP